ncbi:HTH-type transcriptional activator AllS [Photobacterium rosenbergii]|uniref:HTH-type transcriptional activator AllS n=1 Tax=Photobacterium rosenbergii TaxID=294936 RepID=A0ABU3ZDP0_9GAMM|nr:HTH-type transcriptional activator AllS [Photobacterium rosenbergii]MDV5168213.1 HTH-type transcriptional activator AllS [Photobacterium rosenbergii]
MLDKETIRSFMKVAEYANFSKAAEELHKTPAAISYRIKVLEDAVDTQLFTRTTRSVHLTQAGEHLLSQCQKWLDWMESMPDELRQIADGVERHINIVINNLLFDENAVSQLIFALHEAFPFTQINISNAVYMGVWDDLLNNDYHLAIGVPGLDTIDNAVKLKPLGKMSWSFILAPNHPLAALNVPLKESQLRHHPAINIEDTSQHINKRTAWLLRDQKEIKVPDLSTKVACHKSGTGIGFLPKNLAKPMIEKGELIEKEVQWSRTPSPLSIGWRQNSAGEVTQWIIELFNNNDPIIQGFLKNIDQLHH